MEDLYNNSTSQDRNYDYSNNASNYNYHTFVNGMTFTVILISLPVTLMAIYAFFSLIQKDHVAPVYVINLLVSDLIQLCCMMAEVEQQWHTHNTEIFFYIYYFGLMASVGFMVCVSLERYLAIAWPLWYRCRRNIKTAGVVCVMVWVLPVLFLLPVYFVHHFKCSLTIFSAFFLLPFPLLIFFLGGTLKALSNVSSVPPDEKQRIVALLVLVLLIYMLLFLPTIIWSLVQNAKENSILSKLSFTCIQFSPLADSLLYVFLKKGAVDKSLGSLCCCKTESKHMNTSAVCER